MSALHWENDVESELSYAYLHAVVCRSGGSCGQTTRLADNMGIDAQVDAEVARASLQWGARTSVSLKVQLKSTRQQPTDNGDSWSYPLDVKAYDDLRAETHATPRILVVLFLPTESDDWLDCTEEYLLLRRCAYWMSLRGMPVTSNKSQVTIHIPKVNVLSHGAMAKLFAELSRGNELGADGGVAK